MGTTLAEANHLSSLIDTPALRELSQMRSWCVWTKTHTKIPINARTGRCAASDDPSTWSSFGEALAAYRTGNYRGLGVFIQLPYVYVDFDHCRDVVTGDIHPDALAIVRTFKTYTEISQSGAGVKLIGRSDRFPTVTGKNFRPRADKPNHPANRIITWPAGGIELYGSKVRLFCLTGNHLPGTPSDIREAGTALFDLYRQLAPPAPPARPPSCGIRQHVDDATRLQRCLAYTGKMRRAVSGEGGHDATFNIACETIRFDLSRSDARIVMDAFNATLSEPWSAAELEHKLDDASIVAAHERGIRLVDHRQQHIQNTWRPQWRIGAVIGGAA